MWWDHFLLQIYFLYWLLFSLCSTPVVQQQHIKDPGHSAKSAVGRLHLNTVTPLTLQSWSGDRLTMPLRYSVGPCQGRQAHIQLISAQRATAHWSWPTQWNWWALSDLHTDKHAGRNSPKSFYARGKKIGRQTSTKKNPKNLRQSWLPAFWKKMEIRQNNVMQKVKKNAYKISQHTWQRYFVQVGP